MKVTVEKDGRVRAVWSKIEKFDALFPPKTWNHLQGLVRNEDWHRLLVWCWQNKVDFEAIAKILAKGPKRAKT